MVISPGSPNGSGIRARTIDGSSADAVATSELPAGEAAGRLPRPAITAMAAAAIRATATAASSQRPRGTWRVELGVLADVIHCSRFLGSRSREQPPGPVRVLGCGRALARVSRPIGSAPSDVLRMSRRPQPE